ncbi:MAG: hypothetical protein CMJ34_11255 [Phycisphaerae bacterium]|nr:hypothetical protein [Phycisphaerae bacterium]
MTEQKSRNRLPMAPKSPITPSGSAIYSNPRDQGRTALADRLLSVVPSWSIRVGSAARRITMQVACAGLNRHHERTASDRIRRGLQ